MYDEDMGRTKSIALLSLSFYLILHHAFSSVLFLFFYNQIRRPKISKQK